jgi:hypothetical protein
MENSITDTLINQHEQALKILRERNELLRNRQYIVRVLGKQNIENAYYKRILKGNQKSINALTKQYFKLFPQQEVNPILERHGCS